MFFFTTTFIGYFLYIETSKPREPGDYAVLQSKLFLSSKERCLQFYYHMYGDHIETLRVTYSPAAVLSNDVTIWEKSQNQGNQWHLARVNLSSQLPHWTSSYRVSYRCQFYHWRHQYTRKVQVCKFYFEEVKPLSHQNGLSFKYCGTSI